MSLALLRKHWIIGLLGAMLGLGALGAFKLGSQIGQPFGGFYTVWNHDQHVWMVEATTPTWWPAIAGGHVQIGDTLVSLEGRPYDQKSYHQYAEALRDGQTSLRLTLIRGGRTLDADLPIQIFTLNDFLDIKASDLILGLGFWLLAVIVYQTRPMAQINRAFAVAGSLVAGSIWLVIPTLFPEADRLARSMLLGWVITTTLIGVAFIHVATLYPEIARRPSPRRLTSLYLAVAIVTVFYGGAISIRWFGISTPAVNGVAALGNWFAMGMLGLSLMVYLGRLVWIMTRPALSRRIRHQAAMLLWGLLLALPYGLIVVFRVLGRINQSYFWNGLDLRYMALAVPLSFAFVILRYQTFRSQHPSLIGVFLLMASTLIASLGTWLVRLAGPQWANSVSGTLFVLIFMAALLSGALWGTQGLWFGAFQRFFQWDQRGYSAVRLFGQQTAGQYDLVKLPSTIAAALVSNLELERAAVWLWDKKEDQFILRGKDGEWLTPVENLRPSSPTSLISPVRMMNDYDPPPRWLAPLLEDSAIEVVAPLRTNEELVGLLGLGKRWDEEIFDGRDLEIIELIAQEAALLLLVALQVEQLRQVPHQIAIAQEHERFKIAQELHDTIQQFLGSLPFYLEVSRSEARANPAETEATLARCLAEVEAAAQTVRQIRNSLAPPQLEKSLSKPLGMLIEHFHARTGIEVQVEIAPDVDSMLSANARHALFRVVQQALDNVAAHARASRVKLNLNGVEDRLLFAISDDGCGSTEEERLDAASRGSFGLRSMQTRIDSLSGSLTIESTPGAGTLISGWLPCERP